ncbi:MAG: hypothetical protein ISS23_02730 [Nanoarchaeota archaeon]|nr:hypothetical protein [Nanoarchaeota archaeon]
MRSMHLLLNEAEYDWRNDIRKDFPLRSDTHVIRNKKKYLSGRDWDFSTDLKKIFAIISNDEDLQKKFKNVIMKYWAGNPEDLARETLHYLLFHELYHPEEAPFSIHGEDNDNKMIHQAIRRGLLKAEPNLSPLEQVVKVQASQNGVKDFILDNRFSLDNKVKGYVCDDIIPVWDVLELQDSPAKTNFYTITRFLYGVLYGPQSTHNFFESKAGKEGAVIAGKALSTLIKKPVNLPKKKSIAKKAKSLFENSSDKEFYNRIQGYVTAVREIFSTKDRYKGIERFMAVLGPYVEKGMPQGRPDMQGECGVSPQSILQDLLDGMSLEEQAHFISDLAEEGSEQFGDGEANSVTNSEGSDQELNTLDVFAIHEFYKRNHPKIRIVGGNKIGKSVVVGKRDCWDLKRSSVLTEDQLSKVNLKRIDMLQRRTKLPWLIDLGKGIFRLNEYELKPRDVKDVVYVDACIDVPDVVEFYLDSSGSMYQNSNNFGFNDGSRWDMLSNVLYGFVDALIESGRVVNKTTKLRVHNFADSQKSSEIVSVDDFWKGNIEMLKVLFKPQNGYSHEDIDISQHNDGLKRTYVVVTDGNLLLSGRTDRESRKMKKLAEKSYNNVILFEIGGTYDLGNAVKNDPNIVYHLVHDKDRMLQAGLEVLLSK